MRNRANRRQDDNFPVIQRRNQNSILVLATLGVYFGLVLAGATPLVLAQAAMSKQFDVRDEIEIKDDLDTKPDVPLRFELSDNAAASVVEKGFTTFLSQFEPSAFAAMLPSSDSLSNEAAPLLTTPHPEFFQPIERLISQTNFARAGLDSRYSSDAK